MLVVRMVHGNDGAWLEGAHAALAWRSCTALGNDLVQLARAALMRSSRPPQVL